jgi:DNA-binding transcriptional MerR regulator
MERVYIGKLARKFDLNPRTIRYYEGIGLLPGVTRTGSGYRVYTEETENTLRFIIKAKSLGLRLKEIRRIVMLHEKGETPCQCTRAYIRGRISDCDEKIQALAELRERLEHVLSHGPRPSRKTICPIITES